MSVQVTFRPQLKEYRIYDGRDKDWRGSPRFWYEGG